MPSTPRSPEPSLRQAFQLRQGLRDLFVRPDFHQPVVDGVRAFAVLWVVGFHAWFFQQAPWAHLATDDAIADSPYGQWILRGHFGVDLFFVISGFLIGTMLFRELDRSRTIRMRRFYLRRFLRLTPAYLVAMVAAYFLMYGLNARNAWANLLYVNNFLPVERQYMSWCWSLAVEEQFYLVAPLLVMIVVPRSRRVLAWMAVAVVVGWGIRAGILVSENIRQDIHVTFPLIARSNIHEWNHFFSTIYDNFYTRFGGLLIGVAAAWIHVTHHERLTTSFERHGNRALWLTVPLFAGFLTVAVWTPAFLSQGPRWLGLLHHTVERDFFAFCVAGLILCALYGGDGLSRVLRTVLSWRALYPFAQLSYSGYLMHVMMMTWGYPRTTPVLAHHLGDARAFAINAALGFAATFGSAAILYVTVERPCMRLRGHPVIERLGG